jgi:hypothetical protein
VQRGHKRARGAQYVKHHTNDAAQITAGERGQFRRRQYDFDFHFVSREEREGGEKVFRSNERKAKLAIMMSKFPQIVKTQGTVTVGWSN